MKDHRHNDNMHICVSTGSMPGSISTPTGVLLGRCGPSPGVDVMDPESGELMSLASFPDGHGIYSIARSCDGTRVAMATRAGLVRVLEYQDGQVSGVPSSVREFIQGAPVLSVSMLGEERLVASDTLSRCCVWDLSDKSETPSLVLDTQHKEICALCPIPGGDMIGLCSTGELLRWRLPEGRPVRLSQGPPPPSPFALVNVHYWRDLDSLVYPTHDGCLALYDLKTGTIHTRPAHEKGFFALAVAGGLLATAGFHAPSVKLWSPDSNNAILELPLPRGVFLMALWELPAPRVLLVGQDGLAAIHSVADGGLHLVARLPGTGYRSVLGPDIQALQERTASRRAQEVGSIALELEQRCVRGAVDDDDETLHTKLEQLGYPHVSLALRAKWASSQGDLPGEVAAWAKLVPMLPDHTESAPYLVRYGETLDLAWRFREAHDVHARLQAMGLTLSLHGWGQRADTHGAAMQDGLWVADADQPIPLLVQVAAALDEPFLGRWIVRKLKPLQNSYAKWEPEAVLAEYKTIQSPAASNRQPVAALEQPWLLTREGVCRVNAIVFAPHKGDALPEIRLWWRLLNNESSAVAAPMLVLDAGQADASLSPQDHNQHLLKTVERMTDDPLTALWVMKAYRATTLVLQHVLNKSLHSRNRRPR